jgi:ABC-type dipeptide/oligopeptide/nickel transport system permease component
LSSGKQQAKTDSILRTAVTLLAAIPVFVLLQQVLVNRISLCLLPGGIKNSSTFCFFSIPVRRKLFPAMRTAYSFLPAVPALLFFTRPVVGIPAAEGVFHL